MIDLLSFKNIAIISTFQDRAKLNIYFKMLYMLNRKSIKLSFYNKN